MAFKLKQKTTYARYPRELQTRIDTLSGDVKLVAIDALNRVVSANAYNERKRKEGNLYKERRAFFDSQAYDDRYGWQATKEAWAFLLEHCIESDHEFYHFQGRKGKCRDIWFKSVNHPKDLIGLKLTHKERSTKYNKRLKEYAPEQQWGILCSQQLRYAGPMFGDEMEGDRGNIEHMNAGDYVPKRAAQSDRVFTPIICISKTLRKFIIHPSAKKLVVVDGKSMNPTIMAHIMRERGYADYDKVQKIYDLMAQYYKSDVKDAKRDFCKGTNYSNKHNRQHNSRLYKFLLKLGLYGIIKFLDDNNWMLWKVLETYETRSMAEVLKYAKEHNVFVVPMHDGFLTTEDCAEELTKVWKEAFGSLFNCGAILNTSTSDLNDKGFEAQGKGDVASNKRPSKKMEAYQQRLIIKRFFKFETVGCPDNDPDPLK